MESPASLSSLTQIDVLELNESYMENWATDFGSVVVYCPNEPPPEYHASAQSCYVMTTQQYHQYATGGGERVFAMHPLRSHGGRTTYEMHPAKATVYIDDVEGYRNVLLALHERLSMLRRNGCVHLVPIYPILREHAQ